MLQTYKPILIINGPPKCTLLYTFCPLTRALRKAIVLCLTNRPCLEQPNGLVNADFPFCTLYGVDIKTHCPCKPTTATVHLEEPK